MQPVLSDLLAVKVGSQRESRDAMSDMDWKSPFSGRKGGRDVGGSEKISDQPPVALEGWTCQECRAAGQLVVSLPHAATSSGLCRPLVQEES